MTWIVDRIEGDYAVIEYADGGTFNLPLSALPKGIQLGDFITLDVEHPETIEWKTKVNKFMDELWEK